MGLLAAWVLFLVGIARHASAATIPVIVRGSDIRRGEHVVIARMFVGMPPQTLDMEVRFDVGGIVIYRDQSLHSGKHVRGARGPGGFGDAATDAVFFGAAERRTRILDNTGGPPPGLSTPRLCGLCSGILGLRRDSDIWQWWPTATFTPGAITFGSRIAALPNAPQREHTFSCEPYDGSATLCATRGRCMHDDVRISIEPSNPYVAIPRHLRRAYLAGKNIYNSHNTWDTLNVELLPGDGTTPAPLRLGHDDLSGQHGSEARELLVVESVKNDTITLGIPLGWRYAMHFDHVQNTLVLREHPVTMHLSVTYVFLYIIIAFMLIRHKMLSSEQHYAGDPRGSTEDTANIIFEVAGWSISTLLLFLPGVFDVLVPDYPALYGITVAIIAIGGIVTVASRVYVSRAQRLQQQTQTTTMYHVLLAETVWYESVLFSALWLAIVPRRREGVASALTAFAAAWALYSFAGYATQWLTYITVGFGVKSHPGAVRRPSAWLVAFTGVSILALLVHYSWVFIELFMTPFLERVGMIYADLALATTLIISAILIATGAEIASAHVFRAVALQLRARVETLDDTDRSD